MYPCIRLCCSSLLPFHCMFVLFSVIHAARMFTFASLVFSPSHYFALLSLSHPAVFFSIRSFCLLCLTTRSLRQYSRRWNWRSLLTGLLPAPHSSPSMCAPSNTQLYPLPLLSHPTFSPPHLSSYTYTHIRCLLSVVHLGVHFYDIMCLSHALLRPRRAVQGLHNKWLRLAPIADIADRASWRADTTCCKRRRERTQPHTHTHTEQ